MEMSKLEKTIKGFTICSEHGLLNGEDCHGHYEYTDNLADIIKANDYSKQCPYNGCKTGCVKTLAKDTFAMLKEQEEKMEHLNNITLEYEKEVFRLQALVKEQEAVTIKKTKEHGFGVYGGICPKCRNWIQSAHSFCGFCGQAVKWNG